MPNRVLFVTGRLAAPLLADTLARAQPAFAYEIAVMKITVAALMTPEWIGRFLEAPAGVDLVLLPGRMQGDPAILEQKLGIPVEKGPKDLREIPEYFGLAAVRAEYGAHDIRILAEIHNAPSLTLDEIHARARYYADSGADVIDVSKLSRFCRLAWARYLLSTMPATVGLPALWGSGWISQPSIWTQSVNAVDPSTFFRWSICPSRIILDFSSIITVTKSLIFHCFCSGGAW